MAYAAVRRYGLLRWLSDRLNMRKPAALLQALQIAALGELLTGRRPPAVAIDQAVSAARRLPGPFAQRADAGFINATLRRFERERATWLAAADASPQARYGHPAWWVEHLRQSWPDRWTQILEASHTHAPLALRVNPRRGDILSASARLDAEGIAHRRVGACALVLDTPRSVDRIPGFDEGLFTVQDPGAQLAAPWLDPQPGERILDACAAPGGKTTHLLQCADCAVLALDIDPLRAALIRDNVVREGLPLHATWPGTPWGASVLVADAADPKRWWDGTPFDRILLDAPCSASGIVRRHPDVPWHRQRRDLTTFARTQQALLEALWPLLKAGGTLLYVTCSVFPEEGEAVVSAFCKHQADSVRQAIAAAWSDGEQPVTQLFPTGSAAREHDGFFYALLSKQP